MINFIICDDVKKDRDNVTNILNSYMMKNKVDYKTHIFEDYDSKFLKIIETKLPQKIYILDIQTPSRSGIDIARLIRKKDTDSIIIFLTGHEELSEIASQNEFSFLTYINKFVDCKNHLIRALDKAIQTLKVKPSISFKDNGINYRLPLNDILYITRDSVDRKCIIVTEYQQFKIGKPLTELSELLNDNFVQTHRACIVNQKRIICYNKAKKLITFDNGMTTDVISTRFDKELV